MKNIFYMFFVIIKNNFKKNLEFSILKDFIQEFFIKSKKNIIIKKIIFILIQAFEVHYNLKSYTHLTEDY